MKKYTFISAFTLLAAMALPAAAAPGRTAITAAQVAGAINGMGMSVSADQVTLLTEVSASTGSPNLKVQSMEPWGDRRLKVRMDCATHQECLPFYVSVRCNPEGGTNTVATATGQSSLMNQQSVSDAKSFAMRAGSRATLLLEKGRVHIKLSVICLENGAAGQRIRVESKDPQKTYIAEIVDGSILRGSL
jgi:hypothetical protein